jgi:Bacterial SH3 domain
VKSYGGSVHMLPDARSTIVTTLPPGAEVTVVGSTDLGTWDHVVANGVDGYMPHTELTSL